MSFFRNQQTNQESWTISELNSYIRELFEIDFRLQDITVSGEISNFTRARSGHLYFTLKDDQAQLKCVMWRSAAERLHFNPDDGDAVIANGRISVYESGGVYQLYANTLEPAGRGNLALAFEQLKAKLEAEGLFAADHKQTLPAFPRKIGVVTSADAAALRDILNVLRRRYPLGQVLIAPTLVQGDEAPSQIIRALQWLDGRTDIDTIIIARGGGSIEDLWAFNDENVARAIFTARHPIISGVGHETDFTIADFVADVRAPTPSAAAELAVPDLADLQAALQGVQARLTDIVTEAITRRQQQVHTLHRALGHLSPRAGLDNNRQRLDGLLSRLDRAAERRLERATNRLALARTGLLAVSPQATLARGYAIVRDANGRLVTTTAQAPGGAQLNIQVSDGRLDAVVTEK